MQERPLDGKIAIVTGAASPMGLEERRDLRSGVLLGIRFLEQELLEISAVPVPANGAALLQTSGQGEEASPQGLDGHDLLAQPVGGTDRAAGPSEPRQTHSGHGQGGP